MIPVNRMVGYDLFIAFLMCAPDINPQVCECLEHY